LNFKNLTNNYITKSKLKLWDVKKKFFIYNYRYIKIEKTFHYNNSYKIIYNLYERKFQSNRTFDHFPHNIFNQFLLAQHFNSPKRASWKFSVISHLFSIFYELLNFDKWNISKQLKDYEIQKKIPPIHY